MGSDQASQAARFAEVHGSAATNPSVPLARAKRDSNTFRGAEAVRAKSDNRPTIIPELIILRQLNGVRE